MRIFIQQVLSTLDMYPIDWGDVRVVHRTFEEVTLRNEIPELIRNGESMGFGVRVKKNGAWGFAASSEISTESLMKTVRRAIRIAEASAMVGKRPHEFEKIKPAKSYYSTPIHIDPLTVPIEDKLSILAAATKTMQKEKKVSIARGFYKGFKEKRLYADLNGSLIEQDIYECGAGISATAIENGDRQVRSYPNGFGGNYQGGDWSFVRQLELPDEAARVAAEAAELVSAPSCPENEGPLILDSSQVAWQLQHTIAPAIELDRILDWDGSHSNGSFLTRSKIGKHRIGSKEITLTSDATLAGGLGSYAFDDEGVPARKTTLIENGILKNCLACRFTAPQIDSKSTGNMRADGWRHYPLIRTSNLSLEAGTWDLEQLIADTGEGVWMEIPRFVSANADRSRFIFSCELAREIKNGKLGNILKNPIYSASIENLWTNCDAMCGAEDWNLWGYLESEKGEPRQSVHVSYGAAPGRFQNIRTGAVDEKR